jgi:aryl-alcohol dehydrogenase-like predicted oxidoreductase
MGRSMNNCLALGTAQFGLPYGIANQVGRISRDEATTILDHAWAAGLDTIDTAIAYGESEQRLGEIGVAHWQVISKLPEIPEYCTNVAAWVQESVLSSLERLKIAKLRGMLLHRPKQLLGSQGEQLYRAMIALKDEGKVEKIGISIYDPDELDALLPHYKLDLVQAPFNIIDRRLATSDWLKRLHQIGTEVHVRSVFLQGLLLMDAAKRPATFSRWQPLWHQWHSWLVKEALTPLQACLSFVASQQEVNRFIVGVDSYIQLEQVLAALDNMRNVEFPMELACQDPLLINPSYWSLD